jgi:DNA-binding response OmpR family regulator
MLWLYILNATNVFILIRQLSQPGTSFYLLARNWANPSMRTKKIVIIDDDPEICDALSQILSHYGYKVFTALDTRKGQQLFVNTQPDLLILDIMMETMDEGLNFATEIKKNDGVFGVPILIVSARPPVEKGYGRTLDEDLEWIHADIFMEKPIEPEELIHNVKLLVKG